METFYEKLKEAIKTRLSSEVDYVSKNGTQREFIEISSSINPNADYHIERIIEKLVDDYMERTDLGRR